jgi:hypothetical protein
LRRRPFHPPHFARPSQWLIPQGSKYFNNLVTAMQSKAINPCNFIAGYNPTMNAR